jgi:hypothetical protein
MQAPPLAPPAPNEEVVEEAVPPVASTTDVPVQAAAATKDAKGRITRNDCFMSGRALAPSRRVNKK